VRKSTAIVMAILLCAMGAMLVAADMALGPLARDAGVAKELTALFQHREELAPGTKIQVVRVQATEKRLATKGWGLVVRAVPAAPFGVRPARLALFARRLASESAEQYRGERIDWIELELEMAEKTLRTLIRRTPSGELGPLDPPLAPSRRPLPRRTPKAPEATPERPSPSAG